MSSNISFLYSIEIRSKYQELKCTNETFPSQEIENLKYNCYINGQKAWNGVALISKKTLK